MKRVLTLVQSKCLKGGIVMAVLIASTTSAREVINNSYSPTKHVIMVNGRGELLNPENKPYKEIDENEYARYFENIINNIKNQKTDNGKKKILIFVHGGLNEFDSALERAKRLYPEISKDNYYPVFIIWKSGLRSSYFEHLFKIRQGVVYRYWGPVTSPFYLIADFGHALTHAPIVIFHQITTDLKSTFPKSFTGYKNWLELYEELNKRYGANPNEAINISCGNIEWPLIKSYIWIFKYSLTFPIKYSTAPFIAGMGKSSLRNMSRRTKTLFRKPSEFDIRDIKNDHEKVREALDTQPTGAVSQFMESLKGLVHYSAGYEMTLIGHSMGTIVLNEIIRNYGDLPYKNIVYMAAACTIGDFEKSVIPYLIKSQDSKFYNLCLNPIAELCEPYYFDMPPRGSLLEWIDNFLASPEIMLDRTLGKWENIIQATHIFPEDIRGRIYIKAFAADPKEHGYPEGNPTRHADFTDYKKNKFWEETFWKPKDSETNKRILEKL